MDTKEVYNHNAAKWLRLKPSSLSDFTARPYVFDACGDVNERSILDLGCGEGYCARELKRRGAGRYLGVDLSSKMIEAARLQDHHDQYGIEYQACDVSAFITEQKFDLCIAVFLFNYLTVEATQQVFKVVRQALKPGGKFVFSIPHPFFPFLHPEHEPPFYFDSDGKNYFADVDVQFEGEIWKQDGEPLHVQCVHKTLQSYFEGLHAAGFSNMPEITELTVTPELVQSNPTFFAPLLNKPLHMLFSIET